MIPCWGMELLEFFQSSNKWERRVPLTPSHCARLLHSGKEETGVARIIVQPSTKRIYHDSLYEEVGCEISQDLSECGLILGVKQPKVLKSENFPLKISSTFREFDIIMFVFAAVRDDFS